MFPHLEIVILSVITCHFSHLYMSNDLGVGGVQKKFEGKKKNSVEVYWEHCTMVVQMKIPS